MGLSYRENGFSGRVLDVAGTTVFRQRYRCEDTGLFVRSTRSRVPTSGLYVLVLVAA